MIARAVDAALEATVAPSFSRVGPAVRSRLFHWGPPPPGALVGHRALVTGATSGIGRALALALADLGATVHAAGRNVEHLPAHVVPEPVDLADLDAVRELADRMAAHDRLDLVAHVAGALVHEEQRTADGIELTLQVHVVAPHLLTRRLLPRLAEHGGRVLTMTSGGMYTQRLDVAELLSPTGAFDGTRAYARAKRAQVELNRSWAERHGDLGVGFHALHPGWVDTPGLRAGLPGFARRLRPALRTPEQGADTAVWLAWTPDAPAPGGDLWLDRRRRHTVALPWTASPPGEVDRLWDAVEAMAA